MQGLQAKQNRRRQAYGFSDPDAFKGFNREVQQWTKGKQRKLRTTLKRKRIYQTGVLYKATTAKAAKQGGIVDKAGFKLLRYGVFVEKGVGKGRGIRSGKVQLYAKPWFNPTVIPAVNELADIAQQHYADVVVRSIGIG